LCILIFRFFDMRGEDNRFWTIIIIIITRFLRLTRAAPRTNSTIFCYDWLMNRQLMQNPPTFLVDMQNALQHVLANPCTFTHETAQQPALRERLACLWTRYRVLLLFCECVISE
jgi:hypothetical protein